jgi:hypothetical protein
VGARNEAWTQQSCAEGECSARGTTILSCLTKGHTATKPASAGAPGDHQIPSYWNGLAPRDSFDALNAAGHYPGPIYGCPASDPLPYGRGQSHGASADPSEATAPVKRALSMAKCTPQSAPAQAYGESRDVVPAEAQSLMCVQHPGHLPGTNRCTDNLVTVDDSICPHTLHVRVGAGLLLGCLPSALCESRQHTVPSSM